MDPCSCFPNQGRLTFCPAGTFPTLDSCLRCGEPFLKGDGSMGFRPASGRSYHYHEACFYALCEGLQAEAFDDVGDDWQLAHDAHAAWTTGGTPLLPAAVLKRARARMAMNDEARRLLEPLGEGSH